MNDAKQVLEAAINNFSIDTFNRFFREKSRQFVAQEENYSHYNDDDFKNGLKLGEINFSDSDSLIICVFEAKKELSERAGKKAQYEKAKNILRSTENQKFSAGIFIFYDSNDNFRFSLVYPEAIGTHRQWNNFRRFTYFVSCDPQVTNKTFKQRVGDGDFSSLEKIKEAFSVEKVTEEFYQDIANWYFWTVQNVKFPEMVEREENGKNMAVIRMITRLIFIWFMKECGLVPNILFNQLEISKLLKDLSSEKTTYYKAILQNLFFATLNTKNQDRKYRFGGSFQGKNKNYMDHSIYRYENYFKDGKTALAIFKNIPFLNGGLFDCLDRKSIKNCENIEIRIDGFTDKEVGLSIPNFLFFSDLANANLNQEYGTQNKRYNVRGIIKILSTYNFTIDENSPDDQDIALDPELLGKVFENLLASFNPETSTTARKATGSYYTPREIVNYMVTESLKAYFKTRFESIENINEKIEILFSAESQEDPFGKENSGKIVELIENMRIVDPAVGSGAFPMGALNKLVDILNKVDPENEQWKQAQLKAADAIPDPNVRNEAKEKIEKFFQEKNINYLRKLYLIQKCIYGVDIQQIAVEIAKLRFFISLLVDEKIDKTKENWGIEPLPNLDFKIMQGNSLIELFSPRFLAKSNNSERNELIDKFNKLKSDFFNIHDAKEKRAQKEKIDQQITAIADYDRETKKRNLSYRVTAFRNQGKLFTSLGENLSFEDVESKENKEIKKIDEKLKNLEQIGKVSPADHFEWHLYFNEVFEEKGGFDIVIANPPYINVFDLTNDTTFDKNLYRTKFKSASGAFDLYILFHEQSIKLCRQNGIITLISPNKYLSAEYAQELRKFIVENSTFINLLDLSSVKVFEASVYPVVSIYQKKIFDIPIQLSKGQGFVGNIKILKNVAYSQNLVRNSPKLIWSFLISGSISIYKKINEANKITEVCDITASFTVDEAYKMKRLVVNNGSEVISSSLQKKLIISSNVHRYFETWGCVPINYLTFRFNKPVVILDPQILSPQRLNQINQPKIIIACMTRELRAFLDIKGEYVAGIPTVILTNFKVSSRFVLSLLNSNLYNYYFHLLFSSLSLSGGYLRIGVPQINELPYKKVSESIQKPFIEIVDKILVITKSENYLTDPEGQVKVKEYEKQIDQMVYKLYELTPEEIEIVEKNNG